MKVFIKFLLFLLIVLPKVGPKLECQSNNNVTSISTDLFYYKNNDYSLINQIIERHYAAISLSKSRSRSRVSKAKRRKVSKPKPKPKPKPKLKDCKTSNSYSNSDSEIVVKTSILANDVVSLGDLIVKLFCKITIKFKYRSVSSIFDICKCISNFNPVKILPLRVERGSAARFSNSSSGCSLRNLKECRHDTKLDCIVKVVIKSSSCRLKK